jgi:DNA-directed RNA polymerase specialized sigma24 family protein
MAACAGRDPSPTSEARYRELADFCRSTLSPREWDVWRRVEIERVPAVEAAAALGLSPSAVRALAFRARQKILQGLREQR